MARHGKVVIVEAVGNMEVETGKPMRQDEIFRIHSMTKPITTVAALMLVEAGKCKLDDPVSTYLPEFKGLSVYAGKGDKTSVAKNEMTIRDLMRHTSGLTYGMPNGTPVDKLYIENKIEDPGDDLAALVRKLGKLPLQYQPGTRFNYSISTDVLGRLVVVISGEPLDTFFRGPHLSAARHDGYGLCRAGRQAGPFHLQPLVGRKGDAQGERCSSHEPLSRPAEIPFRRRRAGVDGARLSALFVRCFLTAESCRGSGCFVRTPSVR